MKIRKKSFKNHIHKCRFHQTVFKNLTVCKFCLILYLATALESWIPGKNVQFYALHGQIFVWNLKLPSKTVKLSRKMRTVLQKPNCKALGTRLTPLDDLKTRYKTCITFLRNPRRDYTGCLHQCLFGTWVSMTNDVEGAHSVLTNIQTYNVRTHDGQSHLRSPKKRFWINQHAYWGQNTCAELLKTWKADWGVMHEFSLRKATNNLWHLQKGYFFIPITKENFV